MFKPVPKDIRNQILTRVKQGKFADEEPENKDQEPDYIVTSLVECLNLLKTF